MYIRDEREAKDFMTIGAFIKKAVTAHSFERMEEVLSAEAVRKTRRVIITGNGDSYAAAMGLRFFFQKLWNMTDITAERCIDVSRHLHFDRTEDPSETMVIVISQSGTGARIVEVAERAHKRGCTVVAVTCGLKSEMVKASSYQIFELQDRPWKFEYSVQNYTYTNAMVNLYLIALYGGVVRGVITREEEKEYRQELLAYVDRFTPEVIENIDKQMCELAMKWEDAPAFEYVGTGSDIAAAYFGAAKGFEYSGCINSYSDSEDWNHINFFERQRKEIVTGVVASKGLESLSRTKETIIGMANSGRRVLVVTECDKSEFPAQVEVCQLPDTKVTEFKPLMNYIPYTLISFHFAREKGLNWFATTDKYGHGPLFEIDDMNFVKTSKRVYVD